MLGPADASRGLGVSPGRGGGPFPCYPCYPLHAGRKCACSAGVLFCVGEIFAFDAVICYGVGARERESLPIFSSTPVTESVCALFARQPIACWATQERQHSPDAAAAVQLDVVIVRRFEVETLRIAKDHSKKDARSNSPPDLWPESVPCGPYARVLRPIRVGYCRT